MEKVKIIKRIAIVIEIIAIIILATNSIIALKNSFSYSCGGFSTLTVDDSGKYVMESEPFDIKKGDTRMSIAYNTDKPVKARLESNSWTQSLILSDDIILSKNLNQIDYDFIVRQDVEKVKLVIESPEMAKVSIEDVSFVDNNYEVRRSIVYLLIVTIVMSILFFGANIISEKKGIILLGLAVVFVASLPLFIEGLEGRYGQDIEFHLLRIDNIANDLKSFIFPSRIGTVWLDGEGYPSSLYYGDIILYPAAILRIMGFPVIWAFKMFMVAINMLTCYLAYVAFKTVLEDKGIAMLCSFAYVASTYRLFDIFIRGAIGESMALVFLPVVLMGVYLIYTNKNNRGMFYNSTIFALGMTGLVCTHVMSTEMTALALVVFALINFRKTFTKRVILSYLIVIVETIILSLYFIVPFVDVNLHQKVTINHLAEATRVIQHEGIDVAQFFSFFQNVFRELDYKAVTGKAVTPSILLITILVLSIILWVRRKSNREMKIVTILSVLMLFMSTNLFPWDLISHYSKIGNMLAQVQFPWRYLGLGTLFMSLLTGYVIVQLKEDYSYKLVRNVMVALGVIGVSIFTSNYVNDAVLVHYMDTNNMNTENVGIYEYILSGTDWNAFDGEIKTNNVAKLDMARKGSSIHLDVDTSDDVGSIELPVQNYYGYKAVDNEGMLVEIANGDNNNILLSLPANWQGSIDITVGYMLWNIALVVSLLAFIMVIVYFVINKKRQTK